MPEPCIIGANTGDPCSICGQPIEAGHSCSRVVQKADEDGQVRTYVEMTMVGDKLEPREHFKLS